MRDIQRHLPSLLAALAFTLAACDKEEPAPKVEPKAKAERSAEPAAKPDPSAEPAAKPDPSPEPAAQPEGPPNTEAPLKLSDPKATQDTEAASIGTLPEGVGIPVGQPAPDFSATTAEGEPFELSEALGEGEVLLVFYRGGW